MDFRKFLDPIWDLALKRDSKFVIPEFRDTLLVPKITKMRGPPVFPRPKFKGPRDLVTVAICLNIYMGLVLAHFQKCVLLSRTWKPRIRRRTSADATKTISRKIDCKRKLPFFLQAKRSCKIHNKVKRVLKDSLDLIPSPSLKIQIMDG